MKKNKPVVLGRSKKTGARLFRPASKPVNIDFDKDGNLVRLPKRGGKKGDECQS